MTSRRHIVYITNTATDRSTIGPGVVQDLYSIAPIHLARRLSQVLHAAVSEAIPEDFLRNEFEVLVAIASMCGQANKSVASVLALDATTIGQLIDRLEQRGFVRRKNLASDRRVQNLDVTPDGKRLLAKHRPRVLQAQQDVLQVLTATESRALLRLMVRVIEAHPHFDRPGAGRRPPKPRRGSAADPNEC